MLEPTRSVTEPASAAAPALSLFQSSSFTSSAHQRHSGSLTSLAAVAADYSDSDEDCVIVLDTARPLKTNVSGHSAVQYC